LNTSFLDNPADCFGNPAAPFDHGEESELRPFNVKKAVNASGAHGFKQAKIELSEPDHTRSAASDGAIRIVIIKPGTHAFSHQLQNRLYCVQFVKKIPGKFQGGKLPKRDLPVSR